MIFALVRPHGLPEATTAVPGVLLLCLVGTISWSDAGHQVTTMGPTVIFLAAVLALSELARAEGVFRYSGKLMATHARSSSNRLLLWVFIVASVTTAVLSLDATIVLLTPIVLTTTRRLEARPEPHLYATAHLANTASLLLPVSNLTNLLAVAAVPELTFGRFTAVMALPWLLSISIEWLAMHIEFREELSGKITAGVEKQQRAPITALIILGLTLAGFAVCSLLGTEPFWAALGGVLASMVLSSVHHSGNFAVEAGRALRATKPLFLAFVLCLGIIRSVSGNHRRGRRRQRAGEPYRPSRPLRPDLAQPAGRRRHRCSVVEPHQQPARSDGSSALRLPPPGGSQCWPCSSGSTSAPTSATPDLWPPSCGVASSATMTDLPTSADSPGWACSPFPRAFSSRCARCGR